MAELAIWLECRLYPLTFNYVLVVNNCLWCLFFSGRTQKEALEDGKKIQRPDLQVKRYELLFTTKVMLWCISLLLSAWRRSLNVSQNIMNLNIWLKGIQLVFIISPTHSLSSTISLLSLYWLLNRYITVQVGERKISARKYSLIWRQIILATTTV